STFLLQLLICFLHFSEFFFGAFLVFFTKVNHFVGMVFFSHRSKSFFNLIIGGCFINFQYFIGAISTLVKHRFYAFVIVMTDAQIARNGINLMYLIIGYMIISFGNSE